jgi:hypothetical protein
MGRLRLFAAAWWVVAAGFLVAVLDGAAEGDFVLVPEV